MTTRATILILFIAAAAPLLALLTPTPAHAGAAIGVDLELGAPVGWTPQSIIAGVPRYGASVGMRGGYRFDLGPVWIQPEAGGAFMSFQTSDEVSVHVPRLFGGARVGLGLSRVVQPAVFGQGGFGWIDTMAKGPLGAVGLAVDIALVPHFTFGAQVGYNALAAHKPTGSYAPYGVPHAVSFGSTARPIQWIGAGFHAGFTF